MATITTTTAADILGLAFANAQSCFTLSMVPPNYSYFCPNQSAYHFHKTISTMKSLYHLVYRYIFCPPSRRLRQIIKRVLKIIYSFCSFGVIVTKLCSYVKASARSWSSIWQHSPLSSFSFECIPQHFFGSIDTFHTHRCLL